MKTISGQRLAEDILGEFISSVEQNFLIGNVCIAQVILNYYKPPSKPRKVDTMDEMDELEELLTKPRWMHVHGVAKCVDCDWEAGNYLTVEKDANEHYEKTGHQIEMTHGFISRRKK